MKLLSAIYSAFVPQDLNDILGDFHRTAKRLDDHIDKCDQEITVNEAVIQEAIETNAQLESEIGRAIHASNKIKDIIGG